MKKLNLEAIAERFVEERIAMGWNIKQLAEVTDKSRQQIYNYENASSEMTSLFLAKIGSLGLDVQYILTGVKSQNMEAMIEGCNPCNPQGKGKIERARQASRQAMMNMKKEQLAVVNGSFS